MEAFLPDHDMRVVACLQCDPLDPPLELAELTRRARGDGAIVSFVGLARPQSDGGARLDSLVLECHPTLTKQSLEQIALGCAERFAASHIRVVHRYGVIPAGEAILFAGVAATHRRAAFDGANYLVDLLKTEAIFWKREVGDTGSNWIEPRESDYADRARWREPEAQ